MTIPQANMGMRFRVIPGARIRKIVAINSTPTHMAEISVKVIICAHMSTPLPGEYCGPDNGGYANHPASGSAHVNTPEYNRSPPATYIQYPNAFSRGNATLRVPIMSGTR